MSRRTSWRHPSTSEVSRLLRYHQSQRVPAFSVGPLLRVRTRASMNDRRNLFYSEKTCVPPGVYWFGTLVQRGVESFTEVWSVVWNSVWRNGSRGLTRSFVSPTCVFGSGSLFVCLLREVWHNMKVKRSGLSRDGVGGWGTSGELRVYVCKEVPVCLLSNRCIWSVRTFCRLLNLWVLTKPVRRLGKRRDVSGPFFFPHLSFYFLVSLCFGLIIQEK